MEGRCGSTGEFEKNWRQRNETVYNHWIRGPVQNQVQLAFRSHWEVFGGLMGDSRGHGKKALEVGCGRGSMSSYFADAGWDVTLLDYSQSVLEVARKVFVENRHRAGFLTGDVNRLPLQAETFDVIYSIGLLEHFENIRQPIAEQLRVLKPGGWFLGYIVPERPDNLQQYFNWINVLLNKIYRLFRGGRMQTAEKEKVFRSDLYSGHYLKAIEGLPVENVQVFGMYSMPMISHSPEFPFSLLPVPLERMLVRLFQGALWARARMIGHHGWICSEEMGQAFLLAFQKSE